MTMHPAWLLAENSLFKAVGEIFHPLFVLVATVLAYIYGVVPNYVAAIVILTVLIMALLTPLTIKSTRSMMAMQGLQPEMQKLRAKYKGAENRELLNQEMMKLYKEHGVSPTGGCLPMFLQMPALIVLYDVIKGLANTVKKNQKLGTGKLVCHKTLCATPRYIPHNSAMRANLLKTPGVMKSLGLNLAAKPLTHHAHWVDYLPYVALVLVAVGLQYFQMAQMTKRNKKNPNQAQMPQQMQTMQRIMPLIFAYIYFLVPAGVVIYMIVSSGIRVLTQDQIFRHGIVKIPGTERSIGAARTEGGSIGRSLAKRLMPGTVVAASSGEAGAPPPTPPNAGTQPSRGTGQSKNASGAAQGPGRRGTANGGGGLNGRRAAANGAQDTGGPKAHPRSKSKRARKAR